MTSPLHRCMHCQGIWVGADDDTHGSRIVSVEGKLVRLGCKGRVLEAQKNETPERANAQGPK